jgi:hypothetical protein
MNRDKNPVKKIAVVQAFRPAVSGGPEGPHYIRSDFFTGSTTRPRLSLRASVPMICSRLHRGPMEGDGLSEPARLLEGARYAPGVQILDARAPAKASINSLSRFTKVAGSSS